MDLSDRRLNSFKAMKDMFMMYYFTAKMEESNPDKKIAWITSAAPVEPLYAMDVIPVYPENHGALCGTAKMGPSLSEAAEADGFSPDICSYARCDFGQIKTGQSPVGGLPKPDFLVASNNICGTVLKWYEELARHFNVPMIFLDTPFLYEPQTDHSMAYVEWQMKHYLDQLEQICGRKMDMDHLMEVGHLAERAVATWKRVLRLCAHKPAPMSCFDAFVHMAPIVTLRGTQQCLDYYNLLEEELKERISRNFGAIPEERYRLLWDNLPVWYEMRFLSEYLADKKACLVADTYTNAWADNDLDLSDPIKGMARTYSSIYLNINLDKMVDKITELGRLYDVDGVLLHSNRSCKPYSFGQYDMRTMLSERLGKPALVLEADMTDARQFDREQTVRRLDSFIEMLG